MQSASLQPHCYGRHSQIAKGLQLSPPCSDAQPDLYSSSSSDSKLTSCDLPRYFSLHPRELLPSKYLNRLMAELRRRDEAVGKRGEKFRGPGKRNVKAEKKHLEMLMKVQCNSRWSDHDNEVFIVPSKWLNYWKDCANNEEPEHGEDPGPVSHSEIMLDPNEYYHSLDRESQFDWVLKETAEEEKDYYVASKELWEFLQGLYGGTEAIRFRLSSCANHRKLDVRFSKVAFPPTVGRDHLHGQRPASVRTAAPHFLPQQLHLRLPQGVHRRPLLLPQRQGNPSLETRAELRAIHRILQKKHKGLVWSDKVAGEDIV